jgi:hypothetical protein
MGWLVGLVVELVVGFVVMALLVAVVTMTLLAFDPELQQRVAAIGRRLTPRSLSGSADSVR